MELYHGPAGKVREGLNLSVDFPELEGIASRGLFSLPVQLVFKALKTMLENEVVSYVGEKEKHIKDRTAYKHGFEKSSVILGGQKSLLKSQELGVNLEIKSYQ
jgi:hypothetical protein